MFRVKARGRGRPRTAPAAVAAALAVVLAGCGTAEQAHLADGPDPTYTHFTPRVGLLLPDTHTARWETFDRPLIEAKIRQVCPGCAVDYANARSDVAAQRQQLDSMITAGADVLILSPVDSRALGPAVAKAAGAGVPVVSYDRLVDGPISGFVSFDARQTGRLQAEALLGAMGAEADGGRVVMVNGDPADPNAVALERGAREALNGRARVVRAYDTDRWRPEAARAHMSGALAALGPEGIDGVYAANDALAGGVVSALKADFVAPLPPVTGQDADLDALRRIIGGEQYMTVYKPLGPMAAAAAEMAVALGRGDPVHAVAPRGGRAVTVRGVPAVRFTPVPVTAGTVRETVVRGGMYTIAQICTPKYASACARAGLTV
ncbi:substrate-binding domain-containing protein [Streptomyces somaliensis DSM 40738]|uniref:Sugar ABC transporter substrate-binding protein n=1 Tax=Streptomyces somaliensis (strain ATCC 33201 / DSM 40738 / JCM 12659 / KCTC 9044 / NCTC 11332 / NRRL B-12077 / IP 733) TaxID=1134445 RepID=A0AA44ID81_STRE0|nr:substrate-binding domain-containing protein [Streptomyces somaliensis]MCQ0021801.1 substrate-binding domain-containing protein [Streptomyces somaliensis DSM 40738]NKY14376.1 sugar ABC transporter substrate-binding protein [Streptomyces somaliensis DSM 40738]